MTTTTPLSLSPSSRRECYDQYRSVLMTSTPLSLSPSLRRTRHDPYCPVFMTTHTIIISMLCSISSLLDGINTIPTSTIFTTNTLRSISSFFHDQWHHYHCHHLHDDIVFLLFIPALCGCVRACVRACVRVCVFNIGCHCRHSLPDCAWWWSSICFVWISRV